MAHVTEEDIQKLASNLPSSFGTAKNHEVIRLSDKLVGFWGDHFVLKIYNQNSEKLDFFLKAFPRNVEKRMQIMQETGFFEKETKVYEYFVPRLQEISSISWAPKIYLAKENHFIVLENLRDYKLYPSKINIWDLEHFKIAIKTLAVFHASSVIYEEKFGKFSQNELNCLKETAYPQKEGHIRYIGVENRIKILMKLINLIPKYSNSSKLHDVLLVFPDTIRKIFKFAETSKKYRNVLLHGDIWINNVMFKYSEKGDPIECKYVDFQFSRYASIGMDLATTIFASSTADFRELHLNDLLEMYCTAFEKELEMHGIPHSALPRSEILASFQEYRLAGLIESALFNVLTLLPSDTTTDMMNSSEAYEKFFRESRDEGCLKAFDEDYYRIQMTEILSEIIDNFILPDLQF